MKLASIHQTEEERFLTKLEKNNAGVKELLSSFTLDDSPPKNEKSPIHTTSRERSVSDMDVNNRNMRKILLELDPPTPVPQKGDKGERGEKGDSIKGNDGYTPVKNKDYFDGKDGEDGSPDTAEMVRDKLASLKGKERLPASAIKGLEKLKDTVDTMNQVGVIGGGSNQITIQDEGTTVSEFVTRLNFIGSGVSATYLGSGVVAVTISGGGNFADNETPSGTLNGVNTTFILANTPTTGSLQLYLNGQLQTLNTDYTLSGATITTTFAPGASEIIRAFYRYA